MDKGKRLQKSRLKFKFWSRLKKGLFGFIGILVVLSLLRSIFPVPSLWKLTVKPLESLMNLPWLADLFVFPVLFTASIYFLGLLIEKLPPQKPLIKLLSKKLPLIEILLELKENPNAYQAVSFQMFPGVFKDGLLRAEEKDYFWGEDCLCVIFEPRPLALGGEIYKVKKCLVRIYPPGIKIAMDVIRANVLGYGHAS